MIRTVEAMVNREGQVQLLAKAELREPRRALVTILEEEPRMTAGQAQDSILVPFRNPGD